MSKRSRDEELDDQSFAETTIVCTLPPCDKSTKFKSYLEYELHIESFHDYICIECKRRFPTLVFLDLHIDENHNPFLRIQQENGIKIFKCFLYKSGCTKVCSTPKKRRLHMIDGHGYPKEFKFDVINKGITYK